MRRSTSALRAFAALVLFHTGGPFTADLAAQYFGSNKVQYEEFAFQVLRTEHYDIYHYPEEREAAQLAGRMAERWYARLTRLLNYELSSRQPIILYANHPHFEQTNALFGELGEGTGGATEVFKRRVVLPFGAGLRETDHVLGHEIVHAFQYAITGEGRSVQTGGIPGALRLPLWFIEGMAEYLSVGPEDPLTAMWIRDAMKHKLPTIDEMEDPYRWFPYRFGQAFWAWVGGTYGDEVVGRLLKTAGRAPDPQLALSRILGGTTRELSDRWHATIRNDYGPLEQLARPVSDYGTALFEDKEGSTSVSPALSPDGRYIAFLSARDLFSIDVFIAEVATGRVVHKLTRTAVDPHFESLQFINSAGTWSPDGKTFALAAISKGKPLISLIDVESGDKVRDIRLPELGEIYNPSWSPDGRRLAFSAIVGGLSDIFLYDLTTDQLSRLTNDPYADLQPVWSPDGGRLAFVTDRFDTDLATLDYGTYQIALGDPATGVIVQVPCFETGEVTNPQWTPDGNGLYFVSTRNGIPNLYRVTFATGELRQITNLFGGISGITPLSPAVTVAGTGLAVVTSYEKDGYKLYRIDDPTVLAGEPVGMQLSGLNPALLPPRQRISDEVQRVLADARTGLADTAEFTTRPYSASLSLDYISQPSVFFAADQWGTYLGGGAALWWSDMLGNRSLLTGLQINGGIKDVTAVVSYQNLRRRFNWGVTVQNVPFTYRFLNGVAQGTVNGEPVVVEEIGLFRQTNREAFVLGEYPFSRAQRVEFSTGFRYIDYDQELQLRGFSLLDGRTVIDSTIHVDTFDPLHLATASAAIVYDKSLFGATAPILGQRYRIEASPVIGSLNYVGVLGDYRRYFVPARPFTLAFRLLHFGRYAGDSEDDRLRPLYLGYPGLVRGYDDDSFDGTECEPTADDPCPIFSRLIGSRMLIGNAELRFPLLGLLGLGSGYYGFFPIDFVLFGDAGLVWSRDDRYTLTGSATAENEQAFFFGGDRKPVYSAGAGVRVNVFNALIIEIDYSHAFQRDRWLWQFSFIPGF